MRVLGVVMILVSFVLNVILMVDSEVSFVMDSQFKIAMVMFSNNPVLYVLGAVLFFGGFGLFVFGDTHTGVFANFRRKRILRDTAKREKLRREALRKQRERLMR